MNLAIQCVLIFENVGKTSTHQQKTPRYFPSVFFYQHPRTVVWTHLHVGIADVDRNLTTVTPLTPQKERPPRPQETTFEMS